VSGIESQRRRRAGDASSPDPGDSARPAFELRARLDVARALGERLHPKIPEELVSGSQLLASVQAPALDDLP
jgi:hypothetical protein